MPPRQKAWVFVLGDLGRSPRMQYHAASLLKTKEYDVDFIGYTESDLIADLKGPEIENRLTIHNIPTTPSWVCRLPSIFQLPIKAIIQLLMLLYMALIQLPRPDIILLQLPPAVPTMLVCWLASIRHRSKLVYDWHNFGYSLMALKLGRRHPLVKIARSYEHWMATKSSANICVTEAMQRVLLYEWGVEATVLHDRPPSTFHRASVKEQHQLFRKLQPEFQTRVHGVNDFVASISKDLRESETITTKLIAMNASRTAVTIALRGTRPAVVVSSTSWTPDEDFSILLKAAEIYDERLKAREDNKSIDNVSSREDQENEEVKQPLLLPKILFLVTGKGPQREHYEKLMKSMDLKYVAFRTLWLEPQDYPVLLGSADLGLSLHTSSSGLDLPMKVVDMFGCGLPACALTFNCITELVKNGKNGLLFSSPDELADCFTRLFHNFPKCYREKGEDGKGCLLKELQLGAQSTFSVKWHDAWMEHVLPIL